MTSRPENRDPKQINGRVLIVEDEPAVQTLLQRIMSVSNAKLEIASGGREALEFFDSDPDYQFAILDLSLPDLTGFAVLDKIRAVRPTLPVIISSGSDSTVVSDELARDRHLQFLQKPYQISTFWEVVESALAAG